MTDKPANPGVIAPPPLMLLAALVAGLILGWLAPLDGLARIPALWRWIAGGAILAAGVVTNLQGFFRFQHAGTPVRPWKTTTKLVTDGIYAHVRNPMYFGMTALLLALGLALANDWLIICAAIFLLILHFGVVRREERFLEQIFGDEYTAYKKRVPPYGWRF